MTSELKPCPFCGGKAKIYGGPDAQENYSVWCEGHHRINGNSNRDETIAMWNTRAVPDVPELVRYYAVSGANMMQHDNGLFVLHSQAAAIIAAKDAEIAGLHDYLTDKSNQVIELQKELSSLKSNIKRLRDALESIADWPNGGNTYGQSNIKRFARAALGES